MNKKQRIEKLEKELQELKAEINKPEFELGKWYTDGDVIVCCSGKKNDVGRLHGYGVRKSTGVYVDDNLFVLEAESTRPATKEEVEKVLIEEAKRRGFKEGVRVKSAANPKRIFTNPNNQRLNKEMYSLSSSNTNNVIFYNGQWAEIIEEPKVVINGYEMKQDGDVISFGCQEFSVSEIKKLYKCCIGFEITSFYLLETMITFNQLQEIVDNIK